MGRNGTAGVVYFPIEGEMTIYAVSNLREQIIPAVAEHEEIEIDLSRVTEIDAAGVQLMVAAKLEAILRSKTLRYVGHSKAVLDIIDLCDLGSFFGDQVVLHQND